MHPLAWVCVGITIGVAIHPGAEIAAHLIAHQSLIYPQET